MKIGIVFAMEEELNALKKYINITNKKKIYDLIFIEGTIKDKTCILVKSGVGKVNAGRTTQVLIDNYDVDYVFNIGVAGGVSDILCVGDIVVGDKIYQHDFDITAFDHNKGYIPNIGDFIKADNKLLSIVKNISCESVKYGAIASGDIFCTDSKMASKINSKFDALAVEMEGAAVAQVCFLCNIPSLIIRSISDIPNNENKVVYEKFLDESSNKVASYMNEILNKI